MTYTFTIENKESEANNKSLSIFHCCNYSMPEIGIIWLWAPTAILQGIYAKYYGFSLTTLASIILLARLFDVITDPLIGYISDHYQRRTGTRKPFILTGGLLFVISSYFLYVPYGVDTSSFMGGSAVEGQAVSTAYFIAWFLLFYLAFTLFDIPHNAWGSELAVNGQDKSKIYSFRAGAGYLGLVLFYSIPLLPIFESKDITPKTLEISTIIASLLLLTFLFISVSYTPNNSCRKGSSGKASLCEEKKLKKNNISLLSCILTNKPFLLFLGFYVLSGLGFGLWYGVIFLYVDSYLDMGEQFASMFMLSFIVGIAVTPVWYRLSHFLGKKMVLAVAMVLVAGSYIYSGMLLPGETSFLELILMKVTNTVGYVCIAAMSPALLSEIVDYSSWKYRDENTALYFSIYSLMTKANIAIGMALGLGIVGWYGYDATATSQDLEATNGLMLVMVWLPALFAIVSLIVIALNPINARRHKIIRRRLDLMAMRENRLTTLSAKTQGTDSKQVNIASQSFSSKTVQVPDAG